LSFVTSPAPSKYTSWSSCFI